ncbi:unnamed protein product [Urochloa humidicola]
MEEKWSVDVSWTSTWVHIINEGLTVISFVAIIFARIYGIGWLRQLLGRVFGLGGQEQQQSEEGIRGPPPSPRVSEILSWCSDDTIDTGPPPSPEFPQTTTRQDQEIIISAAAETLTMAIRSTSSSSRGAS